MKTQLIAIARPVAGALQAALLLLLTIALVFMQACVNRNPTPVDPGRQTGHAQPATGEALPAAPEELQVAARKSTGWEALADMALLSRPQALHAVRPPSSGVNRENYGHFAANPVHLAGEDPVSTFSVDVDTASYSNVRRILNDGQLPPADAVRVEELINYFRYDYSTPERDGAPFSIATEVTPTPWNAGTHLLRIGLQGRAVDAGERPPANLVFLIDVSGSMQSPDKLELLKRAFRLLTAQLRDTDSVAMVVYAGSSGLVLEPTPGSRKAKIMAALDQLTAGGSTNGGAGIELAYQTAADAFLDGGINRVILATDGDFNVGTVSIEALIDTVERRRESGITLTTLGFGGGNYNDHLMEQLADKGNGNYAYIDTLNEGRKVLVTQLGATLQTIARDVKIQVEFNPQVVAEYRLIGYENRLLNREDFNNDRVDAGDIGAGHTVTALYEVALTGSAGQLVDPLRYGGETRQPAAAADELAYVKLRYKAPDGDASRLLEVPVSRSAIAKATNASDDMRFAAAVAAFGQHLRGGRYLQDFTLADIRALAAAGRGPDAEGYRGEFIQLVDLADAVAATGADRVATR